MTLMLVITSVLKYNEKYWKIPVKLTFIAEGGKTDIVFKVQKVAYL